MPIPQNIEPLWAPLHDEVINLHAYWIIFQQLFGKSEARNNLLYHSARQFFLVVEDALGTDVQLTLGKLSDPAMTGRFQNATLRRLYDDVAGLGNDLVTREIEYHLTVFEAACTGIRDRRNRLIAHSDLSSVLRDGSRPLVPAATIQEIEAALAPLRAFMNAIERAFGEAETRYEYFISREDGDDLVLRLQLGRRYIELQRAGRISWDDIQGSEYM